MTLLYRCPWCVHVERGMKASALMRKHILERHRGLLIRGLGLLESFSTRKPLDPPRNAANGRPPRGSWHTHTSGMPCRCDTLNPGVSGEGDSG